MKMNRSMNLWFFMLFIVIIGYSCNKNENYSKANANNVSPGKNESSIEQKSNLPSVNRRIEVMPDEVQKKIYIYYFDGEKKEIIREYEYVRTWQDKIKYFTNGSIIGKLPINNSEPISDSDEGAYNYEIFFIGMDKKYHSVCDGMGSLLYIDDYKSKQIVLAVQTEGDANHVGYTKNSVFLISDKGTILKEHTILLQFIPETFEIENHTNAIYLDVYSMGHSVFFSISLENYSLKKIREEKNIEH